MAAADALQQLLEVSEDIRAAVVFEPAGEVVAATLPDDEAVEVAGLADAMLVYAGTLRDAVAVRQLEAVTQAGDVYVVADGERAVVAVAASGSLTGLVQHDLRTLLAGSSGSRRRAKAHAAA